MLLTDIINWLPPHTMRISAKSKRISLRFIIGKGLEIVLPRRISKRKIIDFIAQNRAWIEKNQRLMLESQQPLVLPNSIHIEYLDQTWHLEYIHKNEKLFKFKRMYPCLFVIGDLSDTSRCILALKKYLQRFAEPYLRDSLRKLSLNHRLSYNKVTIRRQTTRWGSCSKTKDINLNYKLIFIPKELVEYILIHELCHTVHFDHSKKFWSLVEKLLPNYKLLVQQLKEKERKLPFWINH